MKRSGHLIEEIAEKENLYLAYYKAVKARRSKKDVLEYEKHLDRNIKALQTQLLSGLVSCGHYHYFKIYDPKERIICAASFGERVLHHAIMNVCYQDFERHLINHTYATRPEKGTYAALYTAKEGMKKYPWVAKLDVRKYFDSVKHDILKNKLCRLFKDKKLLNIFFRIIDSYSCDAGRGIPIGNLTSQYFANYYLSDADHYIKEKIRVPLYIRYMDDMMVFANTKNEIKSYIKSFIEFLEHDTMLSLKPVLYRKCFNEIPFLGYKISSSKILLTGNSKKRFVRKMKIYSDKLNNNEWTQETFNRHILPLISFTSYAQSKELRKRVIFAS